MRKYLVAVVLLVAAATGFATPIHIEAESCGLSGAYYNGGSLIYFASIDASTGYMQVASGTATFAIPVAIPNGTYTLSVHWSVGNTFGGSTTYAYLINGINGASVTENGIANQGAWHTYYPSTDAAVTTDDLVGAGTNFAMGPIWSGSPKAATMTVSNVGANDLQLMFWDMSSLNYAYMAIDYFELTPVPEPMTMSLLALGGLALIRRK